MEEPELVEFYIFTMSAHCLECEVYRLSDRLNQYASGSYAAAEEFAWNATAELPFVWGRETVIGRFVRLAYLQWSDKAAACISPCLLQRYAHGRGEEACFFILVAMVYDGYDLQFSLRCVLYLFYRPEQR
jgi:hypothetical protein